MLETIREIAVERLGAGSEATEIHQRHAAAFLALAERAAPHLLGPVAPAWLDGLEREHDNLRAAITWAIDRGTAEMALRFGAALWRFWQMRGHLHEARERLETILAMPGAPGLPAYAPAVEAAGGIAYWQGDFDSARSYYEEQLATARGRANPLDVAQALYNLAFPYLIPKTDVEKARTLLRDALTIFNQAQHRAGIARVHWGLSSVELARGDGNAALGHLNVCIPIFRELKDRFSLGAALRGVGLALMQRNDFAGSRAALTEGLRLFVDARDASGIPLLLQDFSNLALLEGDVRRAARLIGGAAGLASTGGADLKAFFETMEQRWRVGDVELDKEALAAEVDEGRAMSADDLVAYALQPPVPAPTPSQPQR
jgi:tetratricopeptide (TPR) repeat protein